MGFLKYLLIISLFSFNALGVGEVGYTLTEYNNKQVGHRYFANIYERLFSDYYLNPYYENIKQLNYKHDYYKLDLNKHITSKVIVGIGYQVNQNNFNREEGARLNVLIKLWE